MYYLRRLAGPIPSENPAATSPDDLHEWEYHLKSHQASLKRVKGLVDQTTPRGNNPVVQEAQARTRYLIRQFKRAEIGRENRRLVERLSCISRGLMNPDPRGPPITPMTAGGAPKENNEMSVMVAVTERYKQVHERIRHNEQRVIDKENAHIVRRILSIRSVFDVREDAKDFHRHQRAVSNLQRFSSRERSLPPVRPKFTAKVGTLRSIEALLLPGDLQRCHSNPATLSLDPGGEEGPRFKTAPASTLTTAVQEVLAEAFEPASPVALEAPTRSVTEGAATDYSQDFASEDPAHATSEISGGPVTTSPDEEDYGFEEETEAASPDSKAGPQAVLPATGGATEDEWQHHDEATERRCWLNPTKEAEAASGEAPKEVESLQETPEPWPAKSGSRQKLRDLGITGMSEEPDLKYADDWDEFSMTSSSSPTHTRSMHLPGTTIREGEQLEEVASEVLSP